MSNANNVQMNSANSGEDLAQARAMASGNADTVATVGGIAADVAGIALSFIPGGGIVEAGENLSEMAIKTLEVAETVANVVQTVGGATASGAGVAKGVINNDALAATSSGLGAAKTGLGGVKSQKAINANPIGEQKTA